MKAIKEAKMKRKRKWWLWLVIALACMVAVFAIAELTGASVTSILGWGALGAIGVVAVVLLAGVAFVIPFLLRALLKAFVSNHERLSLILGGLGLSAIVIGWVGTGLEARWSLFLIMSGFSMGCLAGAEYQEYSALRENHKD
jgi:hypothetical protein